MDIIRELGLNKFRGSNPDNTFVAAIWLIDKLLDIICDHASENDGFRDSEFRSKLAVPKKEILDSKADQLKARAAESTLELCRSQFESSRILRLERDNYFADIIQFLRASLLSLSGDSLKYHDSLKGTVRRIGNLSNLKDIQELKDRVAEEVKELNRIVEEKQEKERTQYTELSQRIAKLQSKLEKAKAEASIDSLTGIANRRQFDLTLERWVRNHEKSEEPFTIALFDLDNFKLVNDSYGHQVGDQVLAEIVLTLSDSIRSTDFLARYGGEEFIILSGGIQIQESEKRYSEVLKRIARTPVSCRNSADALIQVSLTASCGVAGYALGESSKELIQRADEALYEAKRLGKNRVIAKRRSLLSAFYEGRKRNTIA